VGVMLVKTMSRGRIPKPIPAMPQPVSSSIPHLFLNWKTWAYLGLGLVFKTRRQRLTNLTTTREQGQTKVLDPKEVVADNEFYQRRV